MLKSQPTKGYLRDDVYYCECCGEFYNTFTDAPVDIDLSTVPNDFADLVREHREMLEEEPLPPSTVRSVEKTARRRNSKGFSN